MKKLLSLPPNISGCFHEVTGHSPGEWFCAHDPVGRRLGSGGGTAWLLERCHERWGAGMGFDAWLSSDRRILLHAGGQGRRLPAYAPSGKVLTPIPVFRWERGQRLSQDLLSLQVPLYERILDAAPGSIHTLVASGDVYVRQFGPLPAVPEADVVCFGLWLEAEVARNHGVFVSRKETPTVLERMLQKPSVRELGALLKDRFYLTDIGIWLLGDRAVKVLRERSRRDGALGFYDLYGEFGCALGTDPAIRDGDVGALSVAVLPLPGGEFHHFGTTPELVGSMLAIQNLVRDQREIMHHSLKPHPSIFVQNAVVVPGVSESNEDLWIENSHVGGRWTLSRGNVITGVPKNDWEVRLAEGQCVDVVPVGERAYALRPYGYRDAFRGAMDSGDATFLGMPAGRWLQERGLDPSMVDGSADMQTAAIFPVTESLGDMETMLRWMLSEPGLGEGRRLWESCPRLSADGLLDGANLPRLARQRMGFRALAWRAISGNRERSVFYQVDLEDAAREFSRLGVPEPPPLGDGAPPVRRMGDAMFRAELAGNNGGDPAPWRDRAFALLREALAGCAGRLRQSPRMSVCPDQIVWGRSPARIDIAGGWTDTPPYCLMEGGSVVNLAVELNGQPPLQVYVRPCTRRVIVLRSIDLGAVETVSTYGELSAFNKVGSPFSIPKAALALSGFLPGFSAEPHPTLEAQLEAFGGGMEVTLLSAIPAGSGLGTSSILASTVLGALSDFCGLAWDREEIGMRTLMLEQLLTTGGGWQDQFGGILPGVKRLDTAGGLPQAPTVRWLPTGLYTSPEFSPCHLLFYTGLTRTAKSILSDIVRRMFLNQGEELSILRGMRLHSAEMFEAIQRADFVRMGLLVRRTWEQNQALDAGTNPAEVRRLTGLIDDLALGYKLAGAGGGGYLYIVAKDPEAAARIRRALSADAGNPGARFVDMSLSDKGLQVSRS